MPPLHQPPDLAWKDDGIPVSTRFDDPYFSLGNGFEETRHVFLSGNDLPRRFHNGFSIGELGFGTGLNLIVTLIAWRRAGIPGVLHFTSFEAFPMTAGEMARALRLFPDALETAEPLLDQWASGARCLQLPDLRAEIILGDARKTLPEWSGVVNAWYLDGFSPARNPELWEPALLDEVAAHTAPGGTFATYTAAGFVRRALQTAGFCVERRVGYGHKRHMSAGILQGQP
jgi:tRNA U34 5-methylaminomethyl-2-thiouridine-forming methyltransferase MnmC